MRKRVHSFLLALVLTVGLLPTAALAASTTVYTGSANGWGGMVYIAKAAISGVTVDSYSWDGNTCNVALAEGTAAVATVTFSFEKGIAGGQPQMMGAMTMLASNVLFSQGPWTPWQMFAMGIVGFLAGVLFRKGWLCRGRVSLCIFGALSAIVIYGGIMNAASALMWTGTLNRNVLIAYWISGFPMDCVHAAATWLFLWFAADPMLEKMDRIKVKYGLIE